LNRIGITGHQGLEGETAALVSGAVRVELEARGPALGITSLADGADQIFAAEILGLGGALLVVIPSAGYEGAFRNAQALSRYRDLRARAGEVVELPFARPGEDAYWAAGRRVVELADEMFAVWDGEESGGLGGTGDVVAYARAQGVPVTVIWPSGAARA
jgi:hypothetical protein